MAAGKVLSSVIIIFLASSKFFFLLSASSAWKSNDQQSLGITNACYSGKWKTEVSTYIYNLSKKLDGSRNSLFIPWFVVFNYLILKRGTLFNTSSKTGNELIFICVQQNAQLIEPGQTFNFVCLSLWRVFYHTWAQWPSRPTSRNCLNSHRLT